MQANLCVFVLSGMKYSRCSKSVRFFTDLAFNHYVNDSLMRFFDKCQRFVECIDRNKTALKEVELFKSSVEMDELRRRMSSRLLVPYGHLTPGYNFGFHVHI